MAAEQHALVPDYGSLSTPDRTSPHIHLISKAEIRPLNNPERQFFYTALSIFSGKDSSIRRNLMLTFPESQDEILRTKMRDGMYPSPVPSYADSNIKRLVTTVFKGFIVDGKNNSYHNKTHKLTQQGLQLRKVAQITNRFFSENDSISPEILGNDRSNTQNTPSAAIRAEILIELALNTGLTRVELASKLGCAGVSVENIMPQLIQAKLVTSDKHGKNVLDAAGKHVVQSLLFPIAEISGYPQERLGQIKEALGIKPPVREQIISQKDIQTNDLIGRIKSEKLPKYKKDMAWEELIALYRPLLNTLITIHHLKFHSFSKWEELESFALQGLWRAVEAFDPERGPLTPFARRFIAFEMYDYTDPFVRRTRRPMKEYSLEQMAEEHFNRDEGDILNLSELPFFADESLNPDKLPHGISWIVNVLRELGIPKYDITLLVKKYVEEMNFQDMHKDNVGIGDRAARRHVHELIDQLKANPEARRRLWCKEG